MGAALVTVEQFAELINVSRISAYRLVRAGVIRATDISLPGAKRARLRVAVSEADRIAEERGLRSPKRGRA